MGAFSIPTFSGGFGDGDIFVPGMTSNPGANPLGLTPGSTPSGIILQSGGSGIPTVPGSSAGLDDSNPLAWLQTIFPFAQLGTNAFLANQALTSSRPSTVTYLPNGQIAVSGGGAASPLASSLSSIPSIVWIGIVLLIVVMVIHK
jgi:hypothetical protein